jgi:hypothetical protein
MAHPGGVPDISRGVTPPEPGANAHILEPRQGRWKVRRPSRAGGHGYEAARTGGLAPPANACRPIGTGIRVKLILQLFL